VFVGVAVEVAVGVRGAVALYRKANRTYPQNVILGDRSVNYVSVLLSVLLLLLPTSPAKEPRHP
jgi:hypothetical protein